MHITWNNRASQISTVAALAVVGVSAIAVAALEMNARQTYDNGEKEKTAIRDVSEAAAAITRHRDLVEMGLATNASSQACVAAQESIRRFMGTSSFDNAGPKIRFNLKRALKNEVCAF